MQLIDTDRLSLTLSSLEQIRAQLDAMSPEDLAQVSPEWLARARGASAPDPWIHGFEIVRREDGASVGNCAFKGPPSEGSVEIAYGIAPDEQCKGYATEAARALVTFAFGDERVRTVLAHTLREPNASTRVLKKCGFRFVGEVVDPEDGPVWRWETTRDED